MLEPPSYRQVDVKSITGPQAFTDPWFLGRFGMNLYRGCEHGCAYCDGRAEKYHVDGRFDADIVVKRNAVALLETELSRVREPGFVFVGGGVSDSWQPADATFQLARGALEVVLRRGLPVHVLTKSALVERDFDLLQAIHGKSGAIVSFSIQTLDEGLRRRFEPGAAPIEERWRLLRRARELGLGTGVMAIPVLPGLSDPPGAIEALVAKAAEVGVDFLCFGGLTLRPGVQRDGYLGLIRAYYPELVAGYDRVYATSRASGQADPRYYARVDARFLDALRKHQLAPRIPRRLFQSRIPLYTEIAVLLEHREIESSIAGLRIGGLGRAGMAIQQWARARLVRAGRGGRATWQSVEVEFRSMVEDRSILRIEGVSDRVLVVILELLASAPGGAPSLLGRACGGESPSSSRK